MQVDSDIVTFWIGQTWNLMAFEAAFLPTSVQSQGLPGQLFGRNPQVRLSRIFDAKVFSVELAAAAGVPRRRMPSCPTSGRPEAEYHGWTACRASAPPRRHQPASVAVTGACASSG